MQLPIRKVDRMIDSATEELFGSAHMNAVIPYAVLRVATRLGYRDQCAILDNCYRQVTSEEIFLQTKKETSNDK